MKKMNILFVCKYNRFRSRIAKAYFNKINKNNNIMAESAGIIEGWMPLDENEVEVATELGLNIEGKPKALSTELLKQQDRIIVISNDIPISIFDEVAIADDTYKLFNKEKKLDVWRIQDVKKTKNKEAIIETIKSITIKVDELLKDLTKEVSEN